MATGPITKTGNGAARRTLVESAWSHRFPPRQTRHMQSKARGASDFAKERAWEAQKRFCDRYQRLIGKSKNQNTVITAIARELVGFIWDIGCHELNQLVANRA